MPHAPRRVDAGDDALAELEMLAGYDDDLAGEATRTKTTYQQPDTTAA